MEEKYKKAFERILEELAWHEPVYKIHLLLRKSCGLSNEEIKEFFPKYANDFKEKPQAAAYKFSRKGEEYRLAVKQGKEKGGKPSALWMYELFPGGGRGTVHALSLKEAACRAAGECGFCLSEEEVEKTEKEAS